MNETKQRSKFMGRVLIGLMVISLGMASAAVYANAATPPAQPAAVGFYADGTTLVCVKQTAPYTVSGHSGARTKACPAGTRLGKLNVGGKAGPKGAVGPTGPAGPKGSSASVSLTDAGPLAASTAIKIGGPVADNATKVTTKVNLAPGTYRFTFSGTFDRTAAVPESATETYGSLFLWNDLDGNALYEWKDGEALAKTVQTGAIPKAGRIEAYAEGTGYLTLTTPTTVVVGAHAYNEDQSGTGDIAVVNASATFERVLVGS